MVRRSSALFALSLALIALPADAGPPGALYLQPLGRELPDADVTMVVEALTGFYALPVRVLPRVDLPAEAWYPARRRYRADRLLEFLAPRMPPGGSRILGLTGVDISTTKGRYPDWGVLGLGALDGPAGVISSFRAQRGARDALHARERLAKVAVHEIGHTLGLEHCPTVGCLMEDADGKVATCDREYDLCPKCRARLSAVGRAIDSAPKIPWRRP